MDIRQLLSFAVDNAATEILVSVGQPPLLRFPDALKQTKMAAVTPEVMQAHLQGVLSPESLGLLYRDRQAELIWDLRPGVSFRTTIFSERTSWAITFRLMPTDVPPPAALLLPKDLARVVESGTGMVLVAAPVGHGRSTTLLSLVNVVNQQRVAHILTLERRLKVLLTPQSSVIFQRELGSDPQATVAALNVACIQDPDVLMVTHLLPEMLSSALELAGRGRLVLAGVQATSAIDAVRLMLSSVEKGMPLDLLQASLASSLKMVVAQRLLPRADGKGVIVASEVLPIRVEEARMLRTGDFKAMQAVLRGHGEGPVLGMDRCIQLLFKRGLVERDIARRHMNDEKLLES